MITLTPFPCVFYIISYDIWFYITHRAFHTRLLYSYHKKHHEKRYHTWNDTFYADNLENVVMGLGIFLGIPLIGFHIFDFCIASLYTCLRGYMRHDIKYIDIVGSHHLQHHLTPNYNFSSKWIDKLFNTQYKEEKIHLIDV